MAVSQGDQAFSDKLMDESDPPTQKFLDWFFRNGNRSRKDLLHTLGFGADEAAPGDHRHDGTTSYALLEAADVPGDLPASPTPEQIAVTVNGMLAALRKLTGPVA